VLTVAAAAVVGVLVGRLTGGSTAHLAQQRVRSWGLVVGAAALQAGAHLSAFEGAAVAMVLASGVLLGVCAARNLHLVGMGLVLAGIALNTGVIALNGGMPVRASAADDAGVRAVGAAHHLERDDDFLMALADVIPFSPTGEVLSFGDLVLAVGLADLGARAMHPRPHRSALRRAPSGPRHGRRRAELGAAPSQ
jgi:hypothetical protein